MGGRTARRRRTARRLLIDLTPVRRSRDLRPAVAGLLLAAARVHFVYWMDVATFGAALVTVFLISPQPVGGAAEHRPGSARSSRASASCAAAR